MQNLKLPQKIILANMAIALVFGIVFTIAEGIGTASDFALVFGIVCLAGGLLNLFIGIILLASNKKQWWQGFLLSSAVLFLLSGISCGGGAALS
jgi:Mn2+/Fe2+ NRAMP family transporter